MKFFRKLLSVLLLVLPMLRASGAQWYVDSDVIGSSSNSGASWANAWTNMTAIVWGGSGVKAGDTLNISGGTYTDRLAIGASGTATNRITIRSSIESGHDNEVLMTGSQGRISINSSDYVTISGSNALAYSHTITNAALTTNLSNYISWRINQTNANTAGILGQDCEGIVIQYLNIDGSPGGGAFGTNEGNSGIGFNGNDLTGTNIIQYCYIHDMGQDGVTGNNSPRTNYTEYIIRHNYITRLGDDGIEISGGAWIYRNRIQETTGQHGHPDGIQCPHDWYRIEGNIIGDFNTGLIYGGTRHYTNQYFYVLNNLLYMQKTNATQHPLQVINMDQTLLQAGAQTNYYFSDVEISGNTVVNCNGFITFANRFAIGITNNGQPYTNTLNLSNLRIRNNAASLIGGSIGYSLKGLLTEGINWLDNPLIENNVLYGTNAASLQVNWSGTTYSNIVAFQSATGLGSSNSFSAPSFRDIANFDYRPATNDTVLTGKGKTIPYYSEDLNGLPRDAAPDIGALESPTVDPGETNLLVLLTFDEDFSTTNKVLDTSGFAHHALQWGVSTNPIPYYPTRITSPIPGGFAGSFAPNYGLFPYADTNFWSGQYLGITNVHPRITNMPLATVSIWAKFNSLTNGQSSTSDHNATFVDTGYGVRGAWHFGRYYSTSIGNVRLLINTNAGSVASAPQLVWSNGTYTNDSWHQYAFTFNSTTNTNVLVKLYFDGALLLTTNISLQAANAITGLRITDAPGSTYGQWITVGAWQHNGTPTLDDSDDLPNNGFMNGTLDSLRIYDRVLSDLEIAVLYSLEAPIVASSPSYRRPYAGGRRR